MKIVSQKQARLFGAVASGKVKKPGLKASKARVMLRENRGMRMADMPMRAPTRKPKRTNYRRGGR